MPQALQRAVLRAYSTWSACSGETKVSLEITPDSDQSVRVIVEMAPSEARELAEQLVVAAERSEANHPIARVIPLPKLGEQDR